MGRPVREVLVTLAAGVCLAGPVAGVMLPLLPAAWRRPAFVWGVLAVAVAIVAWHRRRRRAPP
jgi:hypothetical protein